MIPPKTFFKSRALQSHSLWLLSLSLLTLTLSCGKKVDLNGFDSQLNYLDPNTLPPGTNVPSCGASQRAYWKFTQPKPPSQTPVDYLFVMNTSCEMDSERSKIAQQITDFVDTLDFNSDFRISVMLAHGDKSKYSGRLYSACKSDPVLGPNTHSLKKIKSELKENLSKIERDPGLTNGEAMMSSLQRSLTDERIKEIRKQGFYRKNAALSVVMISNRNDICYLPTLHGYNAFPDYVSVSYENKAYQKQCVQVDGQTPNISPESLYSDLKSTQGLMPLVLGAIVHADPLNVPHNNWDTIGHGSLEWTKMNLNSVVIDSTSKDFSSGLAQLSQTAIGEFHLMTEFLLNGSFNIDPNSLAVFVDNKPVTGAYRSDTRLLNLRLADAGQSGSVVEIYACKSP